MASTYLSRTPASAGNRKTWTFSAWVKRSGLSGASDDQVIFGANTSNGSNDEDALLFNPDNNFRLILNNQSDAHVRTNAVFRDVSAWYHLVASVDTTQATASDRVKLYVNGEEVTSLASTSYPSQNYDCKINNTVIHGVGRLDDGVGSATYFDGSMAHVHFIDGTAYDADTFGETDATTGIWKPKTAPSVTYGTNGFFLKFENSAAFGTDSSGNANTFTVNGTMTQTIDTPSNVFATYNVLANNQGATFSNGNLTETGNSAGYSYSIPTLGFSAGKWYCEYKIATVGASAFGISDRPSASTTDQLLTNDHSYAYYTDGSLYYNSSVVATYSSFTTGDIISIAFDADNNKLYFAKNGTWQNSADPALGTGGYTVIAPSTGNYFFASHDGSAGSSAVHNANFGNGYFGTTAVSSAQNPDDGIGIFEHDVPTGYRALCTKSINATEYS